MTYLGDYAEDATLDFMWSSNNGDGASITRATNGTISVYKANGTTQSTAGITDTEDFDGLTGIHHCRIDLSSDAFYAIANDYMAVLSAATIDGQTVNAVLAHFSIQNRYMRGTDSANTTPPPTAVSIRTEIDSNSTQLAAIVADTNELQTDDVPGLISALNDITPAQVNAEVDAALSDIHLDHLFATDYDPASKPGIATALLNELVESDAGVSRYTVNALENAPSGSGASAAAIADAVWDEATADHQAAGSTGLALTSIPGASPGALEITWTIDDGTNPIDGAECWINTDSSDSSANVIWYGTSDSNGIARDSSNTKPFLDAGTYYGWLQHASYTGSLPVTLVVS